MANVAPPSLAAAVSEAGALGSVAAAALSPDEARSAIREVRAATSKPFAVNVFAPPYLRDGTLEVVLEERPAAFSFTFGIVDPAPLREVGILVLGTATTAAEARALEEAGVDAVVAQGAEAGGHRGTFLAGFEDSLVPLRELVPACVAAVSVPVVGAGGIVDAAGVRAALELGAQAVSVGTAFLFTPEAGTPRGVARRAADARDGRDAGVHRPPCAGGANAVPRAAHGRPAAAPVPAAAARGRWRCRRAERLLPVGGTSAPRARELPVAELVAVRRRPRAGEDPRATARARWP